jgi:divalent metal cation (Fe/Co/Zn/Cd) transporter
MADIDARQRQREHALLLAAILDGFIGLLLLVVGLAANSLTCFAESLRGNMMWVIDLVSLAVIRQLHRGRLTGFDFGTGKVEQLCCIAIACGLAVGAAWVAQDAVMLIVAGESTASPLGLRLAAVVGAINVFINFVAFDKVRQAARGRPSSIMDAQARARRARLVASLIVQATMTGAALAVDPLVVAWLDAAGALVVSAIMCRAVLALLRDSIPELLDRSARHLAGAALIEASQALPPGFSLASYRSRGTARALRLEVVVDCPDSGSVAALRAARAVLVIELERLLPGTEISLTLDTP